MLGFSVSVSVGVIGVGFGVCESVRVELMLVLV